MAASDPHQPMEPGKLDLITEVQRADPRHRRLAWLVVAGGAVVGATLILLFEHFGGDLVVWLAGDRARASGRAGAVLLLVALLGTVPSLAMALYLWRLGARIIREERFPPSGVRVARDTIVARGRPAVWRGHGARLLAGALLAAAVGLSLFVWRVWALLDSRPR